MKDCVTGVGRTLVRIGLWTLLAALALAPARSLLAAQNTAPSELSIESVTLGLGKAARVGSWAAVLVRLTDAGAKPRSVVVRAVGKDADGDRVAAAREVTLNPGTVQRVWLYARLPFDAAPNLRIVVNAAVDQEASGATMQDRLGEELASVQLSSGAQSIPKENELLAIVGPSAMGLRQYVEPSRDPVRSVMGHGRLVPVDVDPDDLPDRWMGWAAFDTVVWGRADAAVLRGDRARALREWVERGGHLVIVLPPTGGGWFDPAQEIYQILPLVTGTRREGIDLRPWASLFGANPQQMPVSAALHVLAPQGDADASQAAPILSGPDGSSVVVRRQVGVGAVTLVGVDLTSRAFEGREGLRADVFWHRVLGRRTELLEQAELDEKQQAQTLFDRRGVELDTLVDAQIDRSGRAAAAIFAGFVVFAIYWFCAGPGGRWVLKRRGLEHHAWAWFAVMAVVFTVLAWGGAAAVRPRREEATQLTVLDHVYGQSRQRARSWASVLIPRYGSATIRVGDQEGKIESPAPTAGEAAGALWPWDPVEPDPLLTARSFPDAQGYTIDSREPDRVRVPARATVKQVQVDWAGGPRWGMPRPRGDAPVTLDANNRPVGVLEHRLPAALNEATILLVLGQIPLQANPDAHIGSQLVAQGQVVTLTRPWAPQEALDLETVFAASAGSSDARRAALGSFLDGLVENAPQFLSEGPVAPSPKATARQRLLAMSFYNTLGVPRSSSLSQAPRMNFLRAATHGLDLSRWLTQPCIIVLGVVGGDGEEAESPVPLFVDGQKPRTRGVTLVRWVYPLPPRPPAWPGAGGP